MGGEDVEWVPMLNFISLKSRKEEEEVFER